MKRYLLLLLSLVFALPSGAQSRREALLEYQARRRQAYAEFQDNYRKACADFMRKRWEAFRSEAPVPLPERREPEHPVVKRPDDSSASARDRIPPMEAGEAPDRAVPDSPTGPKTPAADLPAVPKVPDAKKDGGLAASAASGKSVPASAVVTSRPCRFAFYGTECSVSLTAKHRFKLASLQENSIADAWERVTDGSYDSAAKECRELKQQLRLNDWGYYALVRTLSDAFCGRQSPESVVLQSFLMAEAGCKVRLARGGGRLCLLSALDDTVYARPYFKIGGETFYLLDDGARAASYNICNFRIPGERPLSLAMPLPPVLAQKPGQPVVRKCEDGTLAAAVTVNRNLIDFYADYPPCRWSIYAATELTSEVQRQLYPTLRAALAGKDEYDAANLLLHYLHRAFPYKTDEAQFGVERTLFAEEMFHYPYSDCEDRSILFARMVEDLLGLDVVLLYYPEHIATAVRFEGEAKGDCVQVGAERYVVCDPTYIGADAGEAMPDLKRAVPQVVEFD